MELTITEDEELVALARGHFAEQGQQVVGDSLGILAHDAAGVGAAGIEVAQQGAVPLIRRLAGFLQLVALGLDKVGDDLLDHGLCVAVRVGRTDGAVLGNGNHALEARRVAIDGGRRREDDVGHVVALHGAHEGDTAADVDAVVLEGDLARLADGLSDGRQLACRGVAGGQRDGMP